MKLKFTLLWLLAASPLIFSQEKGTGTTNQEVLTAPSGVQAENGKIENGVYICNKFDWKLKIPMNYVVTELKKVENGTTTKQNNPHLIGLEAIKGDSRNTFTSSFESLEGTTIKSFEDHKNFMIKLLNYTYSNIPTLKFELNSTDMKIGKYDFYKIQTKLYDPKTGELLLTQDLYNSFINNSLFSVNINFNNPNIGRLLTDNFISSLSN